MWHEYLIPFLPAGSNGEWSFRFAESRCQQLPAVSSWLARTACLPARETATSKPQALTRRA